jgi:hypothetical protein
MPERPHYTTIGNLRICLRGTGVEPVRVMKPVLALAEPDVTTRTITLRPRAEARTWAGALHLGRVHTLPPAGVGTYER